MESNNQQSNLSKEDMPDPEFIAQQLRQPTGGFARGPENESGE